MTARMRIGVVGAGVVAARYHVPAIRGVPEVRPAFVVDADTGRAARFAGDHGFPRWAGSHEELRGQVDVAVVALPNFLHAPVSADLLSWGIHVLCEKPMARTVEECRLMNEAAARGGALLAVGHNRRFRPHVELARRLVRSGMIGDIVRVDAEEGSDSDWPRTPAYFDPVQSGGGALMDVGIHAIDLIRWMAGEFASVQYRGDGVPGQVENEAELRFTLTEGAPGLLTVSRRRSLAQHIAVAGTCGRLTLGLWRPSLRVGGGRGKAFRHFPHLDLAVPRRMADDSFIEQLRNLVNAAAGHGRVLVDGMEGLAAVDVVTRAYAGAAAGPPAAGSGAGEALSQAGEHAGHGQAAPARPRTS